MMKTLISCFLIVLLCITGVFAQSKHKKQSTAAKAKTGIRAFDFRNFTYYPVGQTNFGYANNAREEKRSTLVLHKGRDAEGSELKSVKYVDFDGDGKEEALVIISTSGGGSMENLYMEDYFIFAYRSGGAQQVFAKSRFGGGEVRVDGRDLVITAPFWGQDAPRCCPVTNEVSIYRWNGNGLAQISRKLQPMP